MRNMLEAINMMFEKMEGLSQQLDTQDRTPGARMGSIARRDSDMTLVSPCEDHNDDVVTSTGSGSSNAYEFAQELFKGILSQLTLAKGSISLPSAQTYDTPGPGKNMPKPSPGSANFTDPTFAYPQCIPSEYVKAQLRKPSLEQEGLKDLVPIPSKSSHRLSQGSQGTSSTSDMQSPPMWRSPSGMSQSPTLARAPSSNYAVSDDDSTRGSLGPLDEELPPRQNMEKGTELLQIVRSGSQEAFITLLRSDASLEVKDEKGRTPLILAASLNKKDFVKRLLEHGGDVRAVDNKSATALHNAIENSSWDTMSVLLRSRDLRSATSVQGDVKSKLFMTDKLGRTPLHCCTRNDRCAESKMEKAARELIAFGADVDARDKSGCPPVYYAIKLRKYSVVQLFLNRDADLEFLRPETSFDVGKLLDNHILEKKREDSSTSPRSGRRGSRNPFRRNSSATT